MALVGRKLVDMPDPVSPEFESTVDSYAKSFVR